MNVDHLLNILKLYLFLFRTLLVTQTRNVPHLEGLNVLAVVSFFSALARLRASLSVEGVSTGTTFSAMLEVSHTEIGLNFIS